MAPVDAVPRGGTLSAMPPVPRTLAALRWLVAAVALAVAAPSVLHFAGRWRLNAATRLQGSETVSTDRTRDLARRLVEPMSAAALDERRALAVELCRAALREAPFSPYAWREAAARLFQLHRDEEATSYLATARRIDPTNPELRFQIGNELALRQGPAAALDDYRTALTIDPKKAEGVWLNFWALGYDPVDLTRALLPPRADVLRAYVSDALDFLPKEDLDRLWERMRAELPFEGDANARLWRRYAARAYEDVRREGGAAANAAARQRAQAVRRLALETAYGRAAVEDPAAWLVPSGVPDGEPTFAGLFNPAFTLPLRGAGLGDWLHTLGNGVRRVETVPHPSPEMPWPGASPSADASGRRWLHVVFEDLGARELAEPYQVMLLPGPATYTLTYEVATSRLFTSSPFRLEVTCWSRLANGRPLARRHRGEGFGGQRPPREMQLVFHVPEEDPGPQSLRLQRTPGGTQDPPVSGELWLRFSGLERSPLDPAHRDRSMSAEQLRHAVESEAPSPLDLLDAER